MCIQSIMLPTMSVKPVSKLMLNHRIKVLLCYLHLSPWKRQFTQTCSRPHWWGQMFLFLHFLFHFLHLLRPVCLIFRWSTFPDATIMSSVFRASLCTHNTRRKCINLPLKIIWTHKILTFSALKWYFTRISSHVMVI